MTENWTFSTLGKIAAPGGNGLVDGPFGSNLPASSYQPHGVPVIRGSNLSLGPGALKDKGYVFVDEELAQKLSRSLCSANDIVFTKKGTLGQTAFIPENARYRRYLLSSNQMKLTVNERIADPKFVYYLVSSQSSIEKILRDSEATGVPKTNVAYLKSFPVFLPPLDEQRSISSLLSSLDDKIELNRRINDTLEAMAQAIFRDWFVDFGPTRRKVQGVTDPVTIVGGLVTDPTRAQELADLFPPTLGDDGLPEGWETRVVGDLLEGSIGGDWGSDEPMGQSNHRIAVIRGTDLPSIEEGGTGSVPYRYTALKKAQRRTLRSDDIVIEVSGGSPKQPTGRSMLITQSILDRFDSDVVCASFCRRFRTLSPQVSILLSLHLSVLYAEGGTWKYQNQSTGISNFQTTLFLETERVNWGGELIAGAFESLVRPMIERMRTNENITLGATRDLLLPKLMSGEIRVGEAEEILEAAQ